MTAESTASFYVRVDGGGTGEPESEAMARWESAHDAGVAEASLRLLQCAVATARDVMSDEEVRAAFDAALDAPNLSVFDVQPMLPSWSLGMLEDDPRFKAVEPITIKIPKRLVGLIHAAIVERVGQAAADMGTDRSANWRRHAAVIRVGQQLTETLEPHDDGPLRLTLDHDQAEHLAAAITHAADGAEEDARHGEDGAEIIRHARMAARLRRLRGTITA